VDKNLSVHPTTDFSVKPVLTGDVVVLRPFRADDIPVLAAIIDDPEVRRFTGNAHLTFDRQQLQSVYQARAHQADRLDREWARQQSPGP
jgi:RimJ/RimL family protein N-acetyltransferase